MRYHRSPITSASSITMFDHPISPGADQQVHQETLKRKSKKKKQRFEISCARNVRTWPILSLVDFSLIFNSSGPFIDNDMKLVNLDLEKFAGWKRAGVLFRQPVIMRTLDWTNVKQSKVEDCSVVSALVVCANYEQSDYMKKPLISRSIYPQDECGRAVFNACGKYGVKLHFNGAERLVVIDDFLPINNENVPLCSQTIRGDELWVSLLEKAYLKLACPYGYDINGSKGDYDLHTFTGWIPDRIRLRSLGNFQAVSNKMEVFDVLHDRMLSGDVLVIASTQKGYEGTMMGLRSGHAYAVLETKMFEGKRFIKLKNPWARDAWRGRFSARDLPSWTPTLRMVLNFTPEEALVCDNGVFWIEYEDLCEFFGTLYLSWNPDVFPHSFQMSQFLSPCSGKERKDGDISSFPQVVLEVGGGSRSTDPAEVWILAMRHVSEGLSHMKTREYVALAVYDSNGTRVEKSDDPRVIFDGFDSRRDPSHYFLAKCCLPAGKYTVVILHRTSQSTCCTMTAYSSVVVTLARVTETCSHSEG